MDYLLVISFILVSGFFYYKRYMRVVESVAHIPGPKPVPFLGNALMFIGKSPGDLLKMGEDFVKTYGFFNKILLGPKIIVFLGEPEDIEVMLINTKTTVKSEEYEYTKDWIGEGLLTSNGQKWFSRRKVITPAFHFKILQDFCQVFDRNSNVYVENLKKFDALDIFPLTLLCALDNICGEIRPNVANHRKHCETYARLCRSGYGDKNRCSIKFGFELCASS
jgi:cytochrome P450 family 4